MLGCLPTYGYGYPWRMDVEKQGLSVHKQNRTFLINGTNKVELGTAIERQIQS
jgi:hypothetical protein